MKRRQWLGIVITCVFCAALLGAALTEQVVFSDTDLKAGRIKIVIDAGHGGFDGGAGAPDGTAEKDLNLSIARSVAAVLTVCGYDVVMTRQTDTGLEHSEDITIRQKKISDMQARLALYEQAQAVISLHQNMFQAANCHGTQVFYSPNHPCSKILASCVREQVITRLQPDNTRELKAGDKTIFLLHKTTKPAILVECGFLSNPSELAKLKDNTYQRKLGFSVACGMLQYTVQRGEGV